MVLLAVWIFVLTVHPNRPEDVGLKPLEEEAADEDDVDEAACAGCVTDKLLALSERLKGFSDEEMLKASGIW